MTLKQLLARRAELLTRCAEVDRKASLRREAGKQLGESVRLGFRSHVELRVVEREIAKMKEPKR